MANLPAGAKNAANQAMKITIGRAILIVKRLLDHFHSGSVETHRQLSFFLSHLILECLGHCRRDDSSGNAPVEEFGISFGNIDGDRPHP